MKAISARTKVCAIIGDPVAHSLSPVMHNAAFEALGLDYRFVAFAVTDARVAIAGAHALGLAGLSVTAPHKEIAFAVSEPDDRARSIGAVNAIAFRDGRVLGFNTDVDGLAHSLGSRSIRRAVLLGAGGAARAVVDVLVRRGATIDIFARSDRELRVGDRAWPVRARTEERLERAFSTADLLVDATPLGLGDDVTLPLHALPKSASVLDLVVRKETPIVRQARARGLEAQTGVEMLLHQGTTAFTLFTGHAAPVEVMRSALQGALA